MARKWLRNKFGRTTPVYECDSCQHYMQKVEKPSNMLTVAEVNVKPVKCNQCEGENLTYHASWKEFTRWRELLRLQKHGFIKNLQRQVRMPVKINSKLIFTYVADFDYYTDQGEHVIEDAKAGVETDIFKLKKKGIEAYYGVSIKIS